MSISSDNVVRIETEDGRSVSTASGSLLHREYLARVKAAESEEAAPASASESEEAAPAPTEPGSEAAPFDQGTPFANKALKVSKPPVTKTVTDLKP